MHEQIKICPVCRAEFFSHVEECNACGVRVVHPEEMARMEGQETKAETYAPEGQFERIEEGSFGRLSEFAGVLRAEGMECEIVKEDESCKSSCSKSGGFALFVPESLVETAGKAIEDYWHGLHPEAKEAKENMEKGLCPCCGYSVGSSPVCPDCGLNLEGSPPEEGGEGGQGGGEGPQGGCTGL
ncbi:MAG: hypothetical protein V3W31_06390 [Thermodesulfobacteriota bacterium]